MTVSRGDKVEQWRGLGRTSAPCMRTMNNQKGKATHDALDMTNKSLGLISHAGRGLTVFYHLHEIRSSDFEGSKVRMARDVKPNAGVVVDEG